MNAAKLAVKSYVAAQVALALPWLLLLVFLFPLSILLLPALAVAVVLAAFPLAFVLFVFCWISRGDRQALNAKEAIVGGALFGFVCGGVIGLINFREFHIQRHTLFEAAGCVFLLGLLFAYIGGAALFFVGRLVRSEK